MNRGKIIAICGIDGSGKSTIMNKLESYFKERKQNFFITQQPTDFYRKTAKVREFMDNGGNINTTKELALLSAYDRLVQHNELEEFHLKKGVNVLTHRHIFATFAIFKKRGLELEWLKSINKECPYPDLTILLDIPGEVAIERISKRGGYIRKEEKSALDLEEIRKNYLEIMPENSLIIDGLKSQNEIFDIIINRLESEEKNAEI